MAELFYSSPRARFFDINAQPLSNGTVEFYYSGTTTLKEIFTDDTEDTQAANPAPLDVGGYVIEGGIWKGSGDYKIVVKDSNGNIQYTQDNIKGADVTGSGVLTTKFVESITNMQGLDLVVGQFVYVAGYNSVTDSGGGFFYYDENSTATDDGGYVINSIGAPASGRYLRISTTNEVYTSEFGLSNENTGTANSSLTNAQAYVVATSDKNKLIVDSNCTLSGNFTFTGDYLLSLESTSIFSAASSVTLTVSTSNAKVEGKTTHVDSNVLLVWSPTTVDDVYPEWWGADQTVTGLDDRIALSRVSTNGRIIMTGSYSASPIEAAAGTFTLDKVHFKTGSTFSSISSFAIITFTDVTFEKNVKDVFTGGSYDSFAFTNEVPVKAFKEVYSNATYYENLLKAVTNNQTVQGKLLWDESGTTSLSNAYVSTAYDIVSRVKDTLISCGVSSTYIGVVNADSEQIISQSTTSVPTMINTTIKLSWFGSSFLNSAASNARNKIAIDKAITACEMANTAGYTMTIDGEDAILFISDTISFDSSAPSTLIKNLTLKEDDAAWIGNDFFVHITSDCYFDNVNIISKANLIYAESFTTLNWDNSSIEATGAIYPTSDSDSNGTPIIFKNGSVTLNNIETQAPIYNGVGVEAGHSLGTLINFIARNCNFQASNAAIATTTTTVSEFTDCTIDGTGGTSTGTAPGKCIVNNLRMINADNTTWKANELYIDNFITDGIVTIVTSDVGGANSSDLIKITNSRFGGTAGQYALSLVTYSNVMENVNITDCYFADKLTFDSNYSVANTTAGHNIIVTDNIFNFSETNIEVDNFVDIGHKNCEVTNNMCGLAGGGLTSSNAIGTTTVLSVNGPYVTNQDKVVSTSKAIFKLFNKPYNGSISCTNTNDATATPGASTPPTFYHDGVSARVAYNRSSLDGDTRDLIICHWNLRQGTDTV